MLLLLMFAFLIGSTTAAARVPICNALRFTGSMTQCNPDIAHLTTIFSYRFDFSVSYNPDNSTFPNHVRITNFESFSSNPSEMYQAAPVWFLGAASQCSTMNGTCFLDFPNGPTKMAYYVMVNGKVIQYPTNARPFLNNANIYDGYYGTILDPKGQNGVGWGRPACPSTFVHGATCTSFYYISVPEDNHGTCMNFESATTVTVPAQNATITLIADYETLPKGIFNITIANFTAPAVSLYTHGPNIHYYQGVSGSTEDPIKYYAYGRDLLNYQFEWTLAITLPGKYGYSAFMGEIIKRNGIFYKDDSIPFTLNDPCQKLNYVTTNNATVQTEFCCTLFAPK